MQTATWDEVNVERERMKSDPVRLKTSVQSRSTWQHRVTGRWAVVDLGGSGDDRVRLRFEGTTQRTECYAWEVPIYFIPLR